MTWGVPPGGARCPCAELREAPCSSQGPQGTDSANEQQKTGTAPQREILWCIRGLCPFPFPCSGTLGPGVSLPRLTCPLGSLAPLGPGKERRWQLPLLRLMHWPGWGAPSASSALTPYPSGHQLMGPQHGQHLASHAHSLIRWAAQFSLRLRKPLRGPSKTGRWSPSPLQSPCTPTPVGTLGAGPE